MLLSLLQSIAIVAILTVAIRFLYIRFKTTPDMVSLLDKPTFLINDTNILVSSKDVQMADESYQYTLCFWLYNPNVSENGNWRNDFEKPKGIISHSFSPNVSFLPKTNTIQFHIGYLNENQDLEHYTIELPQENQRWNHYALTVFDKDVSLYKNGIMTKSTQLPFPPWFSQRNLYIGQKQNNSMTYITNVNWSKHTMDSQQIEKLYNTEKNEVMNVKLPSYVSSMKLS